MSDHLEIIKPEVRGLKPYSLRADRARIKLNQNENAWELPDAIKLEALRRISARRWSRYPDFTPASLRERLAEFAGWRAEGILVGNGSNELIQALLMVTVERGRRVLISEPTFALYRQIVTVLGGDVISVPLTPEFQFDAAALINRVQTDKPAVTIICSPNNPTGSILKESDLAALLEAVTGLVVIDEAYIEFAGASCVPLLERYQNLVVLRTFSKALAMAGLRLGYLLTSGALAQEIGKALLPYNVNVLSLTAAEVVLELCTEQLKPLIQGICGERDRLFRQLNSIEGLSPRLSHANFMLVQSAIDPREICARLLEFGFLVRDVSSYPMLRDYFRVSVGTPAENDELISALRKICVGNLIRRASTQDAKQA